VPLLGSLAQLGPQYKHCQQGGAGGSIEASPLLGIQDGPQYNMSEMDDRLMMKQEWNFLACAALFAFCAPAFGETPEAELRAEAASQKEFYFEVPETGSAVSNWMLGAAITKAAWMQDLTRLMAIGAEAPTSLVVMGKSETVSRKAVQAALKSFNGRKLPFLSLTLIGDPQRGEDLRGQAEALGIRYQVQASPDGAE
jgi:hypothetical protein